MTNSCNPIIKTWLVDKIAAEAQLILDRAARYDDVVRIAVMPDVHAASDVCIGTVMATNHLIYPNAVGGDIGCGMAAIGFDAGAELLSTESAAKRLLSGLYTSVPPNRHHKPRVLPSDLRDSPLSDPRLEAMKHRDAAVQLGTLGRGNHFLEFQADEENRLWLMVHSGSRAIGQAVRDLHVRDGPCTLAGPVVLDEIGRAHV